MTRCPERDTFGNQCNREKGHGGNHESTSYEREKMTYADWLRDELPKVLAETEYWKEGVATGMEQSQYPFLWIEHKELAIEIRLGTSGKQPPNITVDCLKVGPDQAPIISEACHLITAIEAKRREML